MSTVVNNQDRLPTDDASAFTKLIRKYIRLFSLTVFFGSALLLLLVYPHVKEYTNATTAELFVKIVEEILKGLLAASAVAFLYDWVLKAESQREMVNIIGATLAPLLALKAEFASAREKLDNLESEFDSTREKLEGVDGRLQEIKLRSDGDDPSAQTSYLKELILAPLGDGFLPENQQRFYHVYVHSRFRTFYFGDSVKFVLTTTGKSPIPSDDINDLIFYWEVAEWPSPKLDDKWLEVVKLRIGGEPWVQVSKEIAGDAIIAEFQKPPSSKPLFAPIVTYEYDVRVIDNLTSPKTLTVNIHYKLVRPTLRIDARRIGAKAITPGPPGIKALYSRYVNAPEGDGTCEVFMEDSVGPGASVVFTVVGH